MVIGAALSCRTYLLPVIQLSQQFSVYRPEVRRKMELDKIANYQMKNLITGKTSSLEEVCKDSSCVLIFFRRWGCAFCRLWAKEVSEISKTLTQNNVKLIGVSFEDIGAEEFKNGKFFDGDLFVSDKAAYSQLNFKRFSYFSILTNLMRKESRAAISKANSLSVGGDLKGDGLQNGGALILDENGKTLTHFVQDGPAEHLSNSAILKALKINDPLVKDAPDVATSPGQCEMKP